MTEKTKISVTRALAERKALEGQITRSSVLPFVGVQKGTDTNKATILGQPGKTVATAISLFQSNFQAVAGLITRRDALTAAIIKSNAETEVSVNGTTMKVAVAIERKNSIIQERQFVLNVSDQIRAVGAQIERGNAEMQVRVDSMSSILLGKDKSKIDEAAMKNVRDPIEASDKHILLQHMDLSSWAVKELEKINGFVNEVDLILSESNAKTEIEV